MVDPRSLSQTVTVASFQRYVDAQRVVNRLAHAGFPVERIAIVARDLEVAEDVTGRTSSTAAAGRGAASGAAGGALLGLVLGLFDLAGSTTAGIGLVLWGLVIGALVGALMALGSHEVTAGRHDFSSDLRFQAGQFAVVADADVAEDAARLLHSRDRAA